MQRFVLCSDDKLHETKRLYSLLYVRFGFGGKEMIYEDLTEEEQRIIQLLKSKSRQEIDEILGQLEKENEK